MIKITATIPTAAPPAWAVLERSLIDLMDRSVYPYLEKYTHPDGSLIWADRWRNSRDGLDDLYESFYNWPLFYILGGGDHMLTLAQAEWDAITRQGAAFGLVDREYEIGYDQFHQGESYIYFYFLCLADPTNAANIERAKRFAAFYTGEDPDAPNYDPTHRIIRAPHNGSRGPRWGFTEGEEPSYGWAAGMRVYGLPFTDVPGISHYDDLKDPENARRMGQVMHERMGQGDVAGNLIVTSLVANAFLLTGEEKYRQWIVDYVDAWRERAQANGGLLPDNVGMSGQVGEHIQDKWYGGLYGWTWPHGFYNIEMAAIVAGTNAFLITGDERYFELPRTQMEMIWNLGERRDPRTLEMSLGHHWLGQLGAAEEAFVVPYRYGDNGWFDWQPLSPVYPTAIWNITQREDDWQRLETLRQNEAYDWREVLSFRNKEDNGHEQPWLRFLAGDNPDYPEQILAATYEQVCRRLEMIRIDEQDLTTVNIHHWQEHNPVITEALVQLTLGAPQIIYNGGLLHCRLRYFDIDRSRPGLPKDVAALVTSMDADSATLELVNLSPFERHTLLLQAGGFGEHRFDEVTYTKRTSDYPGSHKSYAAPPLETTMETVAVGDRVMEIELPPSTRITLEMKMSRYVNQPAYGVG
jgi:hypothetical protein